MSLPLTCLIIAALLQVPTAVPGLRIAGRVLDGETGKPIPDAVVILSSRNEDSFSRSVTVGADGLFQFTDIPRGSYHLQTHHPNPIVPYRSESLDLDLHSDLEGLGMILSPSMTRAPIHGKVVMAGGAPLPRTISAILFSGELVSIRPGGTFEARLRPAQRYDVEIQSSADGFYIASISGGSWDPASGTWMFRENTTSTMDVVLGVAQQRISGRVIDAGRNPAPEAIVTITGPDPVSKSRSVALTPAGTFSLTGMRSGNYELRAKTATGDATQAAFLRFTAAGRNVTNVEVIVKPATPIRGQVLVVGPRTLEEVLRFKPSIEVDDAIGRRIVPIDSKGIFQFSGFEEDFNVVMTGLPLELRVLSVSKIPGAIEIRVSGLHVDSPRDLPSDRR